MRASKYSLLELLFANRFQWVRKRAKAVWIKDPQNPDWVKFTKKEIEELKNEIGLDLTDPKGPREGTKMEDWT